VVTIPRFLSGAAAALALAVAVLACEASPFQGEIPPCRCEVETCTSASCGYDLRLDQTCVGQLSTAEILIDGHLEREALVPGRAVVPCTRTEPGVESEITIRGGDWVWGPLRERCMEPGEVRLLILQCIESGG